MDEFYKYVADTENIRRNVYTKNEIINLTIDERLEKNNIDWNNIKNADQFARYFGLDYLVEDMTFANMDSRDYIFCLLFGSMGALSSAYLREPFGKIHDGEYRKDKKPVLWKIQKYLEHRGDLMDKELGGLSHRVKYGHDVLNLKEIHDCILDKKQFFIEKDNPAQKAMLNAIVAYINHIFLADPFSKQGIPLPGSSLFRKELVELANKNQDIYQSLFTLKHRDLAGAALVTVLTKLYKEFIGIKNDCYRYYEINIISQIFCIIIGLLVNYVSPNLKNSFNYYSLAKISMDLFRGKLLSNKIRDRINDDIEKRFEELKLLNIKYYNISEEKLNFLMEEFQWNL